LNSRRVHRYVERSLSDKKRRNTWDLRSILRNLLCMVRFQGPPKEDNFRGTHRKQLGKKNLAKKRVILSEGNLQWSNRIRNRFGGSWVKAKKKLVGEKRPESTGDLRDDRGRKTALEEEFASKDEFGQRNGGR